LTNLKLLDISSLQLEEECLSEDQLYLELRIYPCKKFLNWPQEAMDTRWKSVIARVRTILEPGSQEEIKIMDLQKIVKNRLKKRSEKIFSEKRFEVVMEKFFKKHPCTPISNICKTQQWLGESNLRYVRDNDRKFQTVIAVLSN